jgi:hypothetical protein
MNDLRELLRELESRPLIVEGPRRRRLPRAASKFIRRGIESCKAEGKTIRHCVTLAYRKAQRKGLL